MNDTLSKLRKIYAKNQNGRNNINNVLPEPRFDDIFNTVFNK